MYKKCLQQSNFHKQALKMCKINTQITKSIVYNDLNYDLRTNQAQSKILMNEKSKENESRKQEQEQVLSPNSMKPQRKTGRAYKINQVQNIIQKNIVKNRDKKFIQQLYRGLWTINKYFAQIPQQIIRFREIGLREALFSKQKFLMLDLDETLVYLDKQGKKTKQNEKITCKMTYRPYLFQFLNAMQQYYEIYAFTSSKKQYAQAIVQKINKHQTYIQDLLHRDHCITNNKKIIYKDLRIIKNRGLQNIVIIDNTVEYFGMQLNNGIPIISFKGDPKDKVLLQLIPFLTELSKVKDVRQKLKQQYDLQNMSKLNELRLVDVVEKELM